MTFFSRRHRLELSLCFVLLAVLIVLFSVQQRRNELVDDAFITYRYVANLVNGQGLVYNPGEAVLGTTTPGYALLLALPAKLFGVDALPMISRAVNALALIITGLAVGGITWRITRQRLLSVAAGGLVLIAPFTVSAAVYGMEAPVFLMFTALGLWLCVAERWRTGTLLIGLLIWFRPEAVFVIGLHGLTLLVLAYRRRDVRETVIRLVLLALPGIAYAVILMLLYGAPLPHSIYAKTSGLYIITPDMTTDTILQHGARFVRLFLPDMSRDAAPLIAFVHLLLAGAGSVWLAKKHPALWIVPVLALAVSLFYARAAAFIFAWYFGHFELFEIFTLLAGIVGIISLFVNNLPAQRMLANQGDAPHRPYGINIFAGVLILGMGITLLLMQDWNVILQTEPKNPPTGGREQAYYELVQIIRPQIPAGTLIAMPEIGVLGFYLPQAKVLDTAGLVSPQAVGYFPLPPEERAGDFTGSIPKRLIQDVQPDLVIFLEIFGRRNILDDAWFSEHYQEVLDWRGDWLAFGSAALFTHSRLDFAPGMALHN